MNTHSNERNKTMITKEAMKAKARKENEIARNIEKAAVKKEVYAGFGIQYKVTGKNMNCDYIFCEALNMWIKPLLKNGNTKIGRGVWQLSLAAGNIIARDYIVKNVLKNVWKHYTSVDIKELCLMCGGTCCCLCSGCYAMGGKYKCDNVLECLAKHSFIARVALDWMYRAISAQIIADKIEMCRIHVSGDFFSRDYAEMWHKVICSNRQCIFWTYTKMFGHGFDDVLQAIDREENANIVKSVIQGIGFNFGHAGYLIRVYKELKAAGKNVHICACGLDKLIDKKPRGYKKTKEEKAAEIHCNKCSSCFKCEYVLFLEHGTKYNPLTDPDFPEFVKLVKQQQAAEKAA